MREKLGLSLTESPWCLTAALRGVQRTPRVLDLIDIGFASAMAAATTESQKEDVKKFLVIDISQGHDYKPWAFNIGCFTTSSYFYHYGFDRMITEREKFKLLGFPAVDVTGFKINSLQDLVGDAMALPSVGTFLACMVTTLQYKNFRK